MRRRLGCSHSKFQWHVMLCPYAEGRIRVIGGIPPIDEVSNCRTVRISQVVSKLGRSCRLIRCYKDLYKYAVLETHILIASALSTQASSFFSRPGQGERQTTC